jgi:hypothetical protein
VSRLRARNEWKFFAILPRAGRSLAVAWWLVLLLRGTLPAAFAIAMGLLVGAVQRGGSPAAPLALTSVVFLLLQVLGPLHLAIGANLGDRMAGWLYDRLADACLRPPGIGHLEHPELAGDLVAARDFDLGMTGPPISISMDFIAGGMVEAIGGVACAVLLFGYAWWAPLVLGGAWLATHWLLRESGVWFDRSTPEGRGARRDGACAYRLAVEPPPAKELRLFGLAGWVLDRFVTRRTTLHTLQYEATRLREKPLAWSLLLVLGANVVVFWSLATSVAAGHTDLTRAVVFAKAAVGVSMIAFGGLSWAIDGAAAPVAAVLRLRDAMAPAGALPRGTRSAAGLPAREIRFRGVTFGYAGAPVLDGLDLTIPAGSSLAIVGQNGAGKTTIAKLLCRLYDPQSGAIEIDGVDIREYDLASWRSRVAAVFQDFIRLELPLRDNVRPAGGADDAAIARRSTLPGVESGAARHDLARLRQNGLRRSMAARGARARAVRRSARRGCRPARRAHRAARCARRSGDFRSPPRRDAPLHDNPHFPSLLDCSSRGLHLRPQARARRRARHARGADGERRALPDDVRSAGAAVQRGAERRRAGV